MRAQGKTALVLSAGGMFGAYQAGVWDVIGRETVFDLVVGASVGSLNGCLIAAGCTGEELIRRWLHLEDLAQVRWRIPRYLSDGILDSTALEGLIRDLCSSTQPKVEFAVVATELRTMKPRIFRTAEVGWQHIAASCAVPLFLKHFRIDGVYYSDGGLVDPLPVWAALEMGATRIVAVNLLKWRPPLLDRLIRAVQGYSGYVPPSLEDVEFVEIVPSAPLGTPRDGLYWTRANAERWIELGRRDARVLLPQVVEWQRQETESSPENRQECPLIVSTA